MEKTLFYDAQKYYIKAISNDKNYQLAWKGKGLVSIFQNNVIDAKQCFDLSMFLSKENKSELLLLKSHFIKFDPFRKLFKFSKLVRDAE